MKSFSRVQLFATPWTGVYQAPPSMGFSRQDYWSGLPFPSPGIFLTQGSNPGLPHWKQKLLTSEPPGKPGQQKQTLQNAQAAQSQSPEDLWLRYELLTPTAIWNMANDILIPLQSHVYYFLAPPANRWVAMGALQDSGRGFSPGYRKVSTVCCALVAVAQVAGDSSALHLLCAKGQVHENCGHRSGI